jgi:hypothetical protein
VIGETEPRTAPAPTARGGRATRWARENRRLLLVVGVAALVFVAVGAFLWSWEAISRDSSPAQVTPLAPEEGGQPAVLPPVEATVVSVEELRQASTASGRPVYWAGARDGARLEFTRTADGTTYVRYLTGSAQAGAPGAGYVVVATYPQPDAYERVTSAAKEEQYFTAELPGRGRAVVKPERPQNVYVVYPGRPYQVEVYAPTADQARQLVFGGAVRPIAT